MTELSVETQDLLAIGREGVPVAPGRRAAIRAGMVAKMGIATATAIGATTAGAKTASAAGIAAGWGVGFKVVGIAVVAVAVGGGTLAVVKRSDERRAAVTVPSATETTGARGGAPAIGAAASPATQSVMSVDLAVVAPPLERVVAQPASASGRNATARRSESAPREVSVPSGAVTNVATTNAAPSSSSSSSSSSSLETEALLLQDAHRALSAGNGGKTLRLLDEHAARFPNSSLEPERSAERVFALCQVGRTIAAKAAADAFLASHPDGLLATRVRESCMKASE
jgi:hypothetical protein